MLTLSNCLSFARAPLALLFLIENTTLRVVAIVLAMITDSIDGYVARKSKSITRFGAILDPTMDKFFVIFVLAVLFFENQISLLNAGAMIARDFALCIFWVYLLVSKKWRHYQCHAVRWGKITTAFQFLVLIGLTVGLSFPWYVYSFFIVSGCLTFLELCLTISARITTPE